MTRKVHGEEVLAFYLKTSAHGAQYAGYPLPQNHSHTVFSVCFRRRSRRASPGHASCLCRPRPEDCNGQKQTRSKKVAVVDFTDLQGNVTQLGRFIAEELSIALAGDAKDFEVIDRSSIRVILQEHKLASEGVIDPATAQKLGQIAGVDTLVTGTITPLGDSVHVGLKALDTETAKVLAGFTVEIPRTKAINDLLGNLADNTAQHLTEKQVMPGQQQPTETATAEIGDFLFSIQACRHNGDKIECWGTVTNQGSRRDSLVVDDRATSLVDNVGNVSQSGIIYNMSKSVVRIGTSQTWGPGGTVSAELEPALPLVFQVTGVGLDEAASYVSIILTIQGRGKTVMRNILVRKR